MDSFLFWTVGLIVSLVPLVLICCLIVALIRWLNRH